MSEAGRGRQAVKPSKRPSPALLVSLIALAVALSGTAMALPGKNTVDSGDIVNKQVKARDLAKDAVRSGKIKDGKVTGADLADSTVTGANVALNTLTRSDIASGAIWADELGAINERTATVTVNANSSNFTTAPCGANEQVISGGAEWTGVDVVLQESYRDGNGWFARGFNPTGNPSRTLNVHAYCLQGPISLPVP